MAEGASDKPSRAGFFIARDLPAEHVGPTRIALSVERPTAALRVERHGALPPRPASVPPEQIATRVATATNAARASTRESIHRLSEPPPRPVPVAPKPAARDARSDGRVPTSEVAFGSATVRRGPPTIPARAHSPEAIAGSRAARILDELGRCGPGAEDAFLVPLRALGAAGLEALERGFPGLLWFDRNEGYRREPRGRDVSPVAKLLFDLGAPAHPHVARLLENPDDDVRYYATLLAIDLEHPAMIEPLVARLFDPDIAIVRHALRGVTNVGGPSRVAALAQQLVALLDDARQATGSRLRSIELLGMLRSTHGLPSLVAALDADEPALAQRASRALRLLTAHDLGPRSKDWRRFVRDRSGEPRGRWLLDGLLAKDAALRDLAALELASITGETYGYQQGADAAAARRVRDAYERVLPRR